MLFETSKSYFKELSKGNYPNFLNWHSFLLEKYSAQKEPVDSVLFLVLFEWIQNKFSVENLLKVIFLYKDVLAPESNYEAKQQFVASVFYSAAIQFLVYKKLNLHFFRTPSKVTKKTVIEYMESLHSLVKEENDTESKIIINNLDYFFDKHEKTERYIRFLKKLNINKTDDSCVMREGIVEAYLQQIKAVAWDKEKCINLTESLFKQLSVFTFSPDERLMINDIVKGVCSESLFSRVKRWALSSFSIFSPSKEEKLTFKTNELKKDNLNNPKGG